MANRALKLESQAFMAAPNKSEYDFGTGDFTFEAWIKTTSTGTIVSRKGSSGGSNNGGWLLVLEANGVIKLATDNGFGYFEIDSGETSAMDGDWHNVAGVRRGATLAIFLDGKQLVGNTSGNASPPLNVNNNRRLLIGATDQSQEPARFFDGEIDQVRVWNVARSQGELVANLYSELSGSESGLVGYWKLDGNGDDSSSVGNDVTPQGNISYVPPGSPLASSNANALSLTGMGVMQAPNINAYDFGTGPFTVETWFKSTATGTLVSRKGTPPGINRGGWLLVLKPDGIFKLATDDGAGFFEVNTESTGAADGNWHFVAAVRDDKDIFVYLDGEKLPGTYGGNLPPPLNVSNDLRLLMGGVDQNQEPYNRFKGELNQVRVWNVARTQDEIIDWMYRTVPADSSGLQGNWTYAEANGDDRSQLANNASADGSVQYVSPGAPLLSSITAAPVVETIAYSGVTLHASWMAVDEPGVTGYTFAVFDGETEIQSADTPDLTEAMTVALQADSNYTVRVRARADTVAGPWSEPADVISGKPSIDKATYDGRQLSASWSAVTNVGVTGYRMVLFSDDSQIDQTETSETNGTMDVSLETDKAYKITVQAIGGITEGPLSDGVAVIQGIPAIQSSSYDGTTLTAQWSGIIDPSVTGYQMTAFKGDTEIGSGSATGSTGSLEIDLSADTNYTLEVRATGENTAGPYSVPANLISQAPTVLAVSYDETAVMATWNKVDEIAVQGYQMVLYEDGSQIDQVQTGDTGAAISASLEPTKTYTVTLQAMGIATSGPLSDPVTVIVGKPVISASSYDGTDVTAQWSEVNEPAVTGYTMTVYLAGNEVGSGPASGSGGRLTIDLSADKNYTLKVQAIGAKTAGPDSVPADLISQAPEVLFVSYDGSEVKAAWDKVDETAVGGYRMALYEDGSQIDQVQTDDTGALISAMLDPAKTYTVTLQALGQATTGPLSDPIAVIQGISVIATVSYSGSIVNASWSPVDEPAVTGYVMTVFEGSTQVGTGTANGTTGSLALELDPAKEYAFRVAASAGVSVGPESEPVTMIVAAPANPSLLYNGTAFEGSWAAVDETAVTGYQAQLFKNSDFEESKLTTETLVTFDAALVSGAVYQMRVAAEGSKASGPWSVFANGPISQATTYTYDDLGRLETLTITAGSDTTTVTYTYDDRGNMKSVDTATTQASLGAKP